MTVFRVAYTGYIAGIGADHVKRRIPHRFEGGNGTAEIYPTADVNEIAILSADRHCARVNELATGKDNGHEEPQETVREEAEAPASPAEAEEPEAEAEEVAAAPVTKYTREEVVAALGRKNYQKELRPMAGQYGVSMVAEGGRTKKKTALVEDLADAYIKKRQR